MMAKSEADTYPLDSYRHGIPPLSPSDIKAILSGRSTILKYESGKNDMRTDVIRCETAHAERIMLDRIYLETLKKMLKEELCYELTMLKSTIEIQHREALQEKILKKNNQLHIHEEVEHEIEKMLVKAKKHPCLDYEIHRYMSLPQEFWVSRPPCADCAAALIQAYAAYAFAADGRFKPTIHVASIHENNISPLLTLKDEGFKFKLWDLEEEYKTFKKNFEESIQFLFIYPLERDKTKRRLLELGNLIDTYPLDSHRQGIPPLTPSDIRAIIWFNRNTILKYESGKNDTRTDVVIKCETTHAEIKMLYRIYKEALRKSLKESEELSYKEVELQPKMLAELHIALEHQKEEMLITAINEQPLLRYAIERYMSLPQEFWVSRSPCANCAAALIQAYAFTAGRYKPTIHVAYIPKDKIDPLITLKDEGFKFELWDLEEEYTTYKKNFEESHDFLVNPDLDYLEFRLLRIE